MTHAALLLRWLTLKLATPSKVFESERSIVETNLRRIARSACKVFATQGDIEKTGEKDGVNIIWNFQPTAARN